MNKITMSTGLQNGKGGGEKVFGRKKQKKEKINKERKKNKE